MPLLFSFGKLERWIYAALITSSACYLISAIELARTAYFIVLFFILADARTAGGRLILK